MCICNCTACPLAQLQGIEGHPHVVHWHAANIRTDDSFVLCLELGYCDVLEVLHSSDERGLQARYRLREWMLQLAVALESIHKKGVAHRDIKPENLLLCTRHEASFKTSSAGGALVKPNTGPPVPPAHSLARALMSDLEARFPERVQQAKAGDESSIRFLLGMLPEMHREYKEAAVNEVLHSEVRGMRPILKLCDFGYASMVRGEEKVPVGYSPVGSMRYAAPEVYMRHLIFTEEFEFIKLWGRERMVSLQQEPYDARFIDVWSFGVTLYVLVFGSMPFRAACVNDRRFRSFVRESDPAAIASEVCAPDSVYWGPSYDQRPWKWPRSASAAIKHLLQQCMRVDPEKRWSFSQIRTHPWFATPDWQPPTEEPADMPTPSHAAAAAASQASSTPSVRFEEAFRQAAVSTAHENGLGKPGGLRQWSHGSPPSCRRPSAATVHPPPQDLLEHLGMGEHMEWLDDKKVTLADPPQVPPVPGWPAGGTLPCQHTHFTRDACTGSYDEFQHKLLHAAPIMHAL